MNIDVYHVMKLVFSRKKVNGVGALSTVCYKQINEQCALGPKFLNLSICMVRATIGFPRSAFETIINHIRHQRLNFAL